MLFTCKNFMFSDFARKKNFAPGNGGRRPALPPFLYGPVSTQQRNYCVSLLRKIKVNYYYANLEKKILDNKQFWKVVKPVFSDKFIGGGKINLTENGKQVKIEIKTVEVLNSIFSNTVKNLKILLSQILILLYKTSKINS